MELWQVLTDEWSLISFYLVIRIWIRLALTFVQYHARYRIEDVED